MIKSFEDFEVYQRSYKLALEIHKLCKRLPEEERFGLISQMKRASLSIPLNIAEGYGKKASAADFKRFLAMSLGSCNEMQVLVCFTKDLGYLSAAEHEKYADEYDQVGRMLNV